MTWATVVTVSPLTVLVDSDDDAQPALKLASYTTPVVDDRVAVEPLGGRILCLGKVV